METLNTNERTYKIEFIPFEDKVGLNEDGIYDNIYRGFNIEIRFCEEIFYARIYKESQDEISFGSNPYPVFGEDLENVKKYFQEKHGIQRFKYYDQDRDEASYVKF
ncbi:hypothetical protein ABNX05_24400 [Lysinibacillus sp. M3]|uniref:Uncharacterized protein n=1 Tax=Lysinibacillus zambalensis TaxID=3160866 RepID=A0ABV1MZ23_9BACI